MKDPNINKGFTLIELLVATLIIGVTAAIVSPGMLGFVARSKVNTAQGELQGLLQEIQRSAIQKSRTCNIILPNSGDSGTFEITSVVSPVPTPPDSGESCLPIADRTLQDVQIRHNFPAALDISNSDNSIFDFRGNTEDFLSSDLVIVLSNEDTNAFQKCIVVSSGLGLIRVGNYPGGDTSTDVAQCFPTATN